MYRLSEKVDVENGELNFSDCLIIYYNDKIPTNCIFYSIWKVF